MDANTPTPTVGEGVVLQFPTQQLSCVRCYHVAFGSKGLYCTQFNESIVYDSVANECGEYEEDS